MATIVARFYGRFVFLAVRDGILRVLALDPTFAEGVQAAPHRLLLAGPRRSIKLSETTLPADAVIMQPDSEADDRAEIGLWELAGQKTTFLPDGGFQWLAPPTQPDANGRALADLDVLAPGTTVHPDHLREFGAGRPVGAIFTITGGRGSLGQVDRAPSRFAPLATADEDSEDPFDKNLAEFADVTFTVPDDDPVLRLTVQRGETTRSLAFLTIAGDPTRITISNLCSGQHTLVDAEFAATYEVLAAPPVLATRPVPVTRPVLGRRVNCFKAAHGTAD